MRTIELSPKAECSLDEILAYSREKFGNPRAKRYAKALMDRCRMVAKGHLPHRPCRTFFAHDLREDLRFVRAGQHFVIVVETAVRLVIVDFLHQSADIGNRLGAPTE